MKKRRHGDPRASATPTALESSAPATSAAVPPSPRLPLIMEVAILCFAGLPRIWAALFEHGIFQPDEIFQSLEQAHRLTFGFGIVPWEFAVGARSWLLPGVIAGLWKGAVSVGIDSPLALVSLAKLFMTSLGLVGIWAGMRLAGTFGGSPAAALAGLLLASFPSGIILGTKCTSEAASAPLLILAALLVIGSRPRPAIGGALAAAALLLRPQNGIIAAALFLFLWLRGRKPEAYRCLRGTLLVVCAGGLLDWITWGSPFRSVLEYVRFNWIEDGASLFGTEPALFYFTVAGTSTGPAILPIFVGLGLAWQPARPLVLMILAYVGAHMMVPHKEFRFMVPIFPLMLSVAGVGLAGALQEIRTRWRSFWRPEEVAQPGQSPPPEVYPAEQRLLHAAITGLVLAMIMAPKFAYSTLADYGRLAEGRGDKVQVGGHKEPLNRLAVAAGQRPDVCGVAVIGVFNVLFSGGYTYLHRDVPLFGFPTIAHWKPLEAVANYVITGQGAVLPGYSPVESFGPGTLHRRNGGCTIPPDYSTVMPRP